MSETAPRIHDRPHHAVTALRIVILAILAAFVLSLVLSYGRRGKPQATITMAPAPPVPPGQGPVVDKSDEFEINGTREGQPAFTLRAHTVTGFAGERKLLDGVHLTIHDEEGTVQISGREGQFDATARRAQLSGEVTIEGGDGLSLRTGTLFYDSDRDMIFTADEITFSVGGLEGQGRGLNYLVSDRQIKIPDQVRLTVTEMEGAPPTLITSGDLLAALRDNSIVLTQAVRLTRGADVLHSNYLKLVFDQERRRVTHLSAFGDVIATLAPAADGRAGELRSDSLAARFSEEGGAIAEAEASGSCRFTSGPYTSRSRAARYLRDEDLLELRGEPVVLTERDRIAAQEIDLRPQRQELEARGDVRTVSLPAAAASSTTPGFSGRSATSFQARALSVDQVANRAVYSGSARAWQEGNSLQAEEIVIDQADRQLHATGNVMARFTEHPTQDGAQSVRPTVTAITARSLVFDDVAGVARYRDDVRLTRPDATLTADAMDASLKEREGQRDLDRIEAHGSVAVKRGDAFGTGHEAEYQAEGQILILKDPDGLAEVVDRATGRTLKRRTLTFDLAGDRVLTETGSGGRTWITLKPAAKEVQPVEPKPSH
ncbi:MAG TPA: LPS export ABC transporter periplasmic protein LptC [Candidatus Polarisedimenticolia bacterium]|nr:LPS export ABC transporter periplasmic protein LptC [Candidatus Polarisedimenticolia bacterium]